MKVRVRYFASLRELLGSGETVDAATGTSVGALRDQLIARSAAYAKALARGRAVRSALELLGAGKFDAVVLDVMLPTIDGFEVAGTMRASGDYTPVLMLTARGRAEDVLNGFAAGADDYLPKPFELEIFLARLNGLLRRRQWLETEVKAPSVVTVNGRTIDLENLELKNGGELVQLTLMEAKLLSYLIENKLLETKGRK